MPESDRAASTFRTEEWNSALKMDLDKLNF